jgi:hypothetical protein
MVSGYVLDSSVSGEGVCCSYSLGYSLGRRAPNCAPVIACVFLLLCFDRFSRVAVLLHNFGELATSVLSPETEAISPYLRVAILHSLFVRYIIIQSSFFRN